MILSLTEMILRPRLNMPSQVLYPIDRNQSGNDSQEHFNGPHKSYSTHDGLRKYVA